MDVILPGPRSSPLLWYDDDLSDNEVFCEQRDKITGTYLILIRAEALNAKFNRQVRETNPRATSTGNLTDLSPLLIPS